METDTKPAPKPDPDTVFVAHSEWVAGYGGGSGGYSVVEGVFKTRESAELRAKEVTAEYVAMNNTPYISLDGTDNPCNWDFDVHIQEMPLRP